MLVVADTSPLRYLVVIQAIEVLPLLYERVVVPQAVRTELQHPRSPREVRAWLATPPAWVDIRPPQQRPRLAKRCLWSIRSTEPPISCTASRPIRSR